MPRLANGRGLKAHWTYTVVDAALACSVTRGTVRQWIKQGLEVIEGRPVLMRGCDLKAFLVDRKRKRKHLLGPHEFYCFGCQSRRKPAGKMVDYVARTASSGTLTALCSKCSSVMNRHVSQATLASFAEEFDVSGYEPIEHTKGLIRLPR